MRDTKTGPQHVSWFDIYVDGQESRCDCIKRNNADQAIAYAKAHYPTAKQISVVNHDNGEQTLVAFAQPAELKVGPL